MIITEFTGPHRYLSNFYAAPITWNLVVYPTVEHAYQALKTRDPDEQEWVRTALTPAEAKRRGKDIVLREDWNDFRFPLMWQLLVEKFGRHVDLRTKLLQTEDTLLVEGNNWHDTVWGKCHCARHRGRGQNQLGKMLMDIRKDYKQRKGRNIACNSDSG